MRSGGGRQLILLFVFSPHHVLWQSRGQATNPNRMFAAASRRGEGGFPCSASGTALLQ